jgi:hypothetical protein
LRVKCVLPVPSVCALPAHGVVMVSSIALEDCCVVVVASADALGVSLSVLCYCLWVCRTRYMRNQMYRNNIDLSWPAWTGQLEIGILSNGRHGRIPHPPSSLRM